MKLPAPRGPLSASLFEAIRGRAAQPGRATVIERLTAVEHVRDPFTDEDSQLTLWVLYELHYHGFDDVDATWEWEPALLELRAELEEVLENELRRRTDAYVDKALTADGDVADRLFQLTESVEGPSVARFLQREATREQFLEFLIHRSIYHLKESDPQAWVIPRLSGAPKAALVELLYDEYGGGRPDRLHATMFADGLAACGLEREYGAYIEQVPALTLAVNNVMSLFGLHSRLRGASMGHMGAFEATSSLPSRRLAGGVRRLGLSEKIAEYFDEHVEADAVHEQLALRNICGEMVRQDVELERDVFFGAAACLYLDVEVGKAMLSAWQGGRTTLRETNLDPEAVA